MFGFISQKDFMSYDDGLTAGATLVPRAIKSKFDAGKTLLTESENAKLRARAMVEEDLSKEPDQRRRGFLELDDELNGNETNAAETEVVIDIVGLDAGRAGDISGGGDGGDDPTFAGARGPDDDSANVHVESDSIEGQVDHAARDDQSDGGGMMFDHQHKLLSPPSALAEPRVLYAEKQDNEDDDANTTSNGNQNGRVAGQGTKLGAAAAEAADSEMVCSFVTV
jgi:hypothetical protein